MERAAALTLGPVQQNGAHNGRAHRQIRSAGDESSLPNPWPPSPENKKKAQQTFKNMEFHKFGEPPTKHSGIPSPFSPSQGNKQKRNI